MALKIEDMLRKFGVVTVMNVKGYTPVFYASDNSTTGAVKGAWDLGGTVTEDELFTLNSLKITNVTSEGPTKTLTGGQSANDLLYYGKTMRLETQEAVANYEALKALNGYTESTDNKHIIMTDKFPGAVTLVGETYFIDSETGIKQLVNIIFPKMLPDAINSISLSADGDFAVFDMNGAIQDFWEQKDGIRHFYTIMSRAKYEGLDSDSVYAKYFAEVSE